MSKTTKDHLLDTLSDLTENEFKKFKSKLCDSGHQPRIRKGHVEKADRLDLADLLISRYTTNGAVPVTVDILKAVDCNELATQLQEIFEGGLGSAGASGGKAGTPAAGQSGAAEERHFVDVHQLALTERVRNVGAVLDRLLDQGVVTQRVYDEIMAESTCQKKMGKIFSGPILAGGAKAKDVLYQILESQESYLMDDLKSLK